uniref:CHK domain-containing protein n=1 Tax=Rhabditophanes sp. KR3021 TaxID=114890 RepID=A0AC35THU7_9BILA
MTIFGTQQLEDSNIVGTKTEVKWVVECLEDKNRAFKLARGHSKVRKVEAVDISGGKGFASKVYKVTINFDDNSKEPFLIILKVPGMDNVGEVLESQQIDNDEDKEKMHSNQLVKAHLRECKFYDQFTHIPDLKIVKCYGARDWVVGKQEGALIMDYLGSSTNVEFLYGLNVHQAKKFLPTKEWQNEYGVVIDPKEFVKMSPIFFYNWTKVKAFVPSELYKEYEEDILTLLENFDQVNHFILNDLPQLEGNIKTFIHSDININNVCFKEDGDGNPGNEVAAIIDWQTAHCGSIGADIARVLVTGCPAEIRREIEVVNLPIYYENLKNEIIKRGGQFDMSWEMFKLNYDYCEIDQCMHLLMMYAFGLIYYSVPEEAGDYLWDARKYSLGSRIVFAMVDAVKKCRILKPECRFLVSNYECQTAYDITINNFYCFSSIGKSGFNYLKGCEAQLGADIANNVDMCVAENTYNKCIMTIYQSFCGNDAQTYICNINNIALTHVLPMCIPDLLTCGNYGA